MDRPVVLCGLGRVGYRILDHLAAAGLPVVVVSLGELENPPANVRFVKGDCRKPQVLEAASIRDASGVIIVTSDDLVNVSTAMLARRLNPTARLVVRMFNQNLIPRLGNAVRNSVALSVSALTAPLLALMALTGDTVGAFKVAAGPLQVAEVKVEDGSDLAGRRIKDVAAQFKLLVLAHTPAGGPPELWAAVGGDVRLAAGDAFVAVGAPADLAPLLSSSRGELFAGVRWAGWVRRQFRALRRAVGEIDTLVKVATVAVVVTLAASTTVFVYGFNTSWPGGLYQTVTVIATGADLPGKDDDIGWHKVFLSGLKLAGAALVAGFTAIFTQYLIRARLGGAFESRRIPDGGHVVVCGLGNVGFRCIEELVKMGAQVVAVEKVNDNPFAATVRRMGIPVIVGDAAVPEVLRQARADTARAVIAATNAELANLEIGLLVRELNPTQRVVVRLTDPAFADAVREAAEIRYAVSVPALAAPAFAAALLGDRVQTLLSVAGKTLAVADLVVQPDDPILHETSLVAAMIDYRFLPVAVNADPPFTRDGLPKARRLAAGDCVTVIAELPDLDRLLRRQPAPTGYAVVVDAFPLSAREHLIPLIRTRRGCSQDDALKALAAVPFRLAENLTRGGADELLGVLGREKVTARATHDSP